MSSPCRNIGGGHIPLIPQNRRPCMLHAYKGICCRISDVYCEVGICLYEVTTNSSFSLSVYLVYCRTVNRLLQRNLNIATIHCNWLSAATDSNGPTTNRISTLGKCCKPIAVRCNNLSLSATCTVDIHKSGGLCVFRIITSGLLLFRKTHFGYCISLLL